MRVVSILILICFVSLIFVGQSLYSSDLENNEIRDIYNHTESSFNWSGSFNMMEKTLGSEIDEEVSLNEYDINVKRFKNIVIKFVDFLGYSSYEGVKMGIEYGYEHPEHDLEFFLGFLIKIIWILLIIALIPLVVPLLAIIYLSFKGMYWLVKKGVEFIRR